MAHWGTRYRYGGDDRNAVSWGEGAESGAGCEPICAHGVEDSRWLHERRDYQYCADTRRLPLAGHRIRFTSLRWRPECCVVAPRRAAASGQQCSEFTGYE